MSSRKNTTRHQQQRKFWDKKFKPPKPTVQKKGILDLVTLFKTNKFAETDFSASIQKSFRDTGVTPLLSSSISSTKELDNIINQQH
jgi:hypothetical protein